MSKMMSERTVVVSRSTISHSNNICFYSLTYNKLRKWQRRIWLEIISWLTVSKKNVFAPFSFALFSRLFSLLSTISHICLPQMDEINTFAIWKLKKYNERMIKRDILICIVALLFIYVCPLIFNFFFLIFSTGNERHGNHFNRRGLLINYFDFSDSGVNKMQL